MANIPEIELVRDEITGELIPEIWKPIPDYEGLYEVSNYGRIKSLAKAYFFGHHHSSLRKLEECLIKLSIDNVGYFIFVLKKDGTSKTQRVHQMVAIVFLDHKPDRYNRVVNHKNLNKLNNFYRNLEIVTNRENSNQKHIQSTSEFVGVSLAKERGKKSGKVWRSMIYLNGKRINLGYFTTEIEASNAYQVALAKHLSKNDNVLIEK